MMTMRRRGVKMLGWVCGAVTLSLAGCHSAYVVADLRNDTTTPLSLVELDYPSASFGVESIAAGATYHYRFKILGDGPTSLQWTDASRQLHTVAGPHLREGQQGILRVSIHAASAVWDASALKP